MKFQEFFNTSEFTLFATGDSNWDLYTMHTKNEKPRLVALAKPGTGAEDCFYGSMDYLNQLERRGINHGFTKITA